MEQAQFIEFEDLGVPALICPGCDGMYLHQTIVEVYAREEDDDRTLVTTISHKGDDTVATGVIRDCSTNPSARRHGLRVYFECENCDAAPLLVIAQHKGNSLCYWEVDPEDAPGQQDA